LSRQSLERNADIDKKKVSRRHETRSFVAREPIT
jgi:hypothetical protein